MYVIFSLTSLILFNHVPHLLPVPLSFYVDILSPCLPLLFVAASLMVPTPSCLSSVLVPLDVVNSVPSIPSVFVF